MDATLDNANNPFANSNGTNTDNEILSQKPDGLLLNLSENLKHNGQDLSPAGDFYHNIEKSNRKRLASEFDEEEEEKDDDDDDDDDDDHDDLGPETDVDAGNECLSPAIVTDKVLAESIANNNPNNDNDEVEKVTLEIDLDLQKQQSSEFDDQRSPREETPTPPAHAVHDGGIVDNVGGDSGEESEDEWNYYKGEDANKENIKPSLQPDTEVAELSEDSDNMSQLNPNAAEFVPISPTRSNPSPACRALMNDPVIAQSPKRPGDIDISLPNLHDFESEVKSRPSDVGTCRNGHGNQDDTTESSQELMGSILNGKSIDEIPEFQPSSQTTPTKSVPSEEFHFGPNAAPFTPVKLLDQSEIAGLSTQAIFGDETTTTIDADLNESKDNVDFVAELNKVQDPMSMSFYQDQEDSSNPFDLNKVQVLPDDLEEFLSKPSTDAVVDEANSDLPELEQNRLLVCLDNDERIQTTDLDKVVDDDEKELASPLDDDDDLRCNLSSPQQSPETNKYRDMLQDTLSPQSNLQDIIPESPHLLCQSECVAATEEEVLGLTSRICQLSLNEEINCGLPSTNLDHHTQDGENKLNIDDLNILDVEPEKPLSSHAIQLTEQLSSQPTSSSSPFDLDNLMKSSLEPPIFESQVENNVLSPEPQELQIDVMTVNVLTPEPLLHDEEFCNFKSSVVPNIDEVCQLTDKLSTPVPQEEVCDVVNAPKLDNAPEERGVTKTNELSIGTPVEDVTSSVRDSDSPLPSENIVELEIIAENIPMQASSPVEDIILLPDTSKTDTESVATADVNSFLERSQVCDVITSPLSSSDGNLPPVIQEDAHLDLNHPLMKCVYPIQQETTNIQESVDIKTDKISPEFAEPMMIALSPNVEEDVKEVKKDDVPVMHKETLNLDDPRVPIETETIAIVAVGAIAAVAAATRAVEKKSATKPKAAPTTPSTKKPATKTTTSPTKSTRTVGSIKPSTATLSATTSVTKNTLSSKSSVTAPKLSPKPKTTLSTTNKVTERKPLNNNGIAVKKPSELKTSLTATTKPLKSSTLSKTLSSPRPSTAPTKAVGNGAMPKLKSTTLVTKSTSSTAGSKTTTAKTSATKILNIPKPSTSSTIGGKTRPVTAPAKAKVPLGKAATKTADTEKQIKESANKLTASRNAASMKTTTTATAITGKPSIAGVKKAEAIKNLSTRTTKTTTTTTVKPTTTTTTTTTTGPKKATDTSRAITKTKTTKVEKPQQNGVSTVVTEQITIVNSAINNDNNSEPQLIKDNSPVDNKLLIEQTNAAD